VGTVPPDAALPHLGRDHTSGTVADEIALLHEVGTEMTAASLRAPGPTAYTTTESAIHRLGLFGTPPIDPHALPS
jgi:hypothetical protein